MMRLFLFLCGITWYDEKEDVNLMIVRNILKTDNLSLISKVYIDSFIETYKAFISSEFLEGLAKEDWLNDIQNHKDFFVMIQDKDIIGTASIHDRDNEDESGEILDIYLSHDYVDHGYGRLLLHAMAMELLERGYERAHLWDIEENLRAASFYKKNGFSRTDEKRVIKLGGKNLTQVKYSLDLKNEFMIR